MVGNTRRDLTEVAFEEQALGRGIEQDLVIAKLVALIAAEFDARHAANLGAVERTQKHMDALGRGQPQIEVEIEPRREVGGVDLTVVVIGRTKAQIAIGQQLRARRVLVAENRDAVTDGPGLIHRIPPFYRRARTWHGMLVAIDRELGGDVVGLIGIARVGAKQFPRHFRSLGLRRHLGRLGGRRLVTVYLAFDRFRDGRQRAALASRAAR